MNNLPITPFVARDLSVQQPVPAPALQPEPNRLMTMKEAAEYCKVHRGRISAALEMKEIRVVNLGPRTNRIWLSDLKKWLDSKTVKTSTRASWLS
jgi:excisionase family DNA binding protein